MCSFLKVQNHYVSRIVETLFTRKISKPSFKIYINILSTIYHNNNRNIKNLKMNHSRRKINSNVKSFRKKNLLTDI